MADTLEIRLGDARGSRLFALGEIDFRKLLAPLVDDISEAASIEAGIEVRGSARSRPSDKNEPLVLALSGVSEPTGSGSGAAYEFTVGPIAVAAVGQITAGLAGLPSARLVPDAAKHVREGVNRAIKKGLSVQLVNGVTTPVFNVRNPPPEIAVHPTRTFDTEIAVKLLRVGGRRPAARVQLLGSQQQVTAHLTGPTAARELGRHLYHTAVLVGRGEWVIDPDRFFRPARLLAFKVTDYHLLDPLATDVVFDKLSEAAGGVWDDTDPTKLRDDDGEGEASEGAS